MKQILGRETDKRRNKSGLCCRYEEISSAKDRRIDVCKMKLKLFTLFCVLLSFSQPGWCQDLQFDVLLEPKLPEKSSVYIIAKLRNNTADTFRVAHFTHLYPTIEMELTNLETGM
ncbi:hypothetical protein IIC38_13240, partial [candidate division KSB1 bacterium]|nr:hypothetical protein [candidate division KSB1 bacterium]